MANVRDLVGKLLKDDTVKEKVPYTPPPEPAPPPPSPERRAKNQKVVVESAKTDGLLTRIESMNRGPVMSAQKSDLPYTLHDHTVDIDGEIGGGFLVRMKSGTPIGYIWCTQQQWKWKTMKGENFGERSTRRKAAEVLVEIYNTGGQDASTKMP